MYARDKETSTSGKITIQSLKPMGCSGTSVFLKYCHRIRDRCYRAMANDMSARPHEILNLKIKDIIFR